MGHEYEIQEYDAASEFLVKKNISVVPLALHTSSEDYFMFPKMKTQLCSCDFGNFWEQVTGHII